MSTETSFMDRHHYLLRRLHSLTGIVPIGLFLIAHLTTNATIVWGAINKRAADPLRAADGIVQVGDAGEVLARQVGTFQHEVTYINNLPFLVLIEWTLWISIAFHAVLGLVYATTGRGNTGSYKYQSNVRYSLQRLTGYVGLLFIVYHIGTLRWGWTFLQPNGEPWTHTHASSTLAAALRGDAGAWSIGGVFVALLYFAGITSLVFHFANGLWTAAITWGLTITEKAQRRWGVVCAVIGFVLMGAAWSSLAGFLALNYQSAREIEMALEGSHSGSALVRSDTGVLESEAVESQLTRANEPMQTEGGDH